MTPPRSCSGCMAPPLPSRHPAEAVGRAGHVVALCGVCLAGLAADAAPALLAALEVAKKAEDTA